MLTIFFRAVILYGISIWAIRMMGKRQIGQLQPYELVAALLVADLAAGPIAGSETPLLYGIIPIAALMLMHSFISILGLKFPAFRRFVNGSSCILIENGCIRYKELSRVCLTVSDLLEDIRENGVLSISDVQTAVLETNGTLSVFPRALARPLTPKDMQLSPEEETLSVILIADGKVRDDALTQTGISLPRLRKQLNQWHFRDETQVLLCCYDTPDRIFVQGYDAAVQPVRALIGDTCITLRGGQK
ncbi:MAG: DUF421 domain-containing protein [Clostridia bacterium]|nr:DUF421 domain-containing protein [Clostridia bacterium]